jgi:hypothetical protein
MKKNKTTSLINVKKIFKFQPKNTFTADRPTDPTATTVTMTSSVMQFN